MAEESLASRYQKWLLRNPGKTFEQFKEAILLLQSTRSVGHPNVRYLPDGIVVPVGSFDQIEFAQIGREIIQSAYQQQ